MTVHMRPSQIEFRPLDRLKPYARNAKTHDADQVARIAASMAEFGWTVNCLMAMDGELTAEHLAVRRWKLPTGRTARRNAEQEEAAKPVRSARTCA